ncbi:hypothetical protein ARMGADRAFT_1021782 [Armillaria gallica]|uniref:Uncharacterized protein n=1 Tax=Armillaria gallica TaxID=47427 RepID=A0A2H3C7G1_ARMGA|nr:hypothetical protein ARMGADRAFT_1021782 [Armillaria gallica]
MANVEMMIDQHRRDRPGPLQRVAHKLRESPSSILLNFPPSLPFMFPPSSGPPRLGDRH